MTRKLLILLVSVAATVSPASAADAPELGAFGVDLSAMKTEVAPGDDFFRHVNGQWLETFEIPADFTNYGAFTVLFERSESRIRTIIEEAAGSRAAAGSIERKIGDYYKAYTDKARIDRLGLRPAETDLRRIRGVRTHADVAKLMADPELGINSVYQPYIYVDSKQSDRYLPHMSQGGLGMPGRDFYLDERFAERKAAYRTWLAKMLTLAGEADAEPLADAILAAENAIAEAHWPLAKQRDPVASYNYIERDELVDLAPQFPWADFLMSAGLGDQQAFIVNEPDAFARIASIFADTPIATWRAYLTVHYLSGNASVLPSEIDDANFDFYGRTLSGQPEQRERWKRGVNAVNGALGEAVGQVYVAKHFPPESKAQMEQLIVNLRKALAARIDQLEWMSPETKAQAHDKLAKFRAYVGYPDEWRDYADLKVSATDALGNAKRARASGWRYQLARLGKPVEPGKEWGMTPQTVNAYFSPPRNAIYFPAAILQPPFFDPNADPAVNYGGIGAVIGHEIGHGFDDQGRKYDGDGRLRVWWTAEDAERFETRAAKLGAQFATYSPLEGHAVDPDLTMGENVGDLGGLSMAYHAYRLSLGGEAAPVIDGYTGDQRFFLAWAQVWRRKYREQELMNRLVNDPHSPSEYRTNGIVRNLDAWYEAFGVEPGDAMYLAPEERVSIW